MTCRWSSLSLLAAVLLIGAGLFGAEALQIRTMAGNGESSGPVDGAVAEGTPAGTGFAVAVDAEDRVLITTTKGEIWRIANDGRWEFVWRSSSAALLFGLAVDAKGSVFASDALSNRVFRIDPDGGSTLVAAADRPVGLAVDAAGNLFISESGRIRMISPAGMIETYVSGVEAGPLSADPEGNLYLADFVRGEVRKIAPDRTITAAAKAEPFAVAACANGGVYFTSAYRVSRIEATESTVIAGGPERAFAVENGPAGEARFETPLALTCDGRGRLVIFDATAARLRRIEAMPGQ